MSIQSVARALQVLALFSHRHPDLGIAEISRFMGLPKGTIHGLVRTLMKERFLQQDPQTRRYRLGLRIHELGIIMAGTLELNQKAGGPAHQLAKETQFLARVASWDGDSVVVTLNAHARPRAAFPHQIGPRVHAYCSAIGKAVLAFLEENELQAYLKRTALTSFTPGTMVEKKSLLADLKETRQRGFSIDREEAVQGVACIGAPIFVGGGAVCGSISLSGAPNRIFGARMKTLTEELMKTAAEISRYMGHFPAEMRG